MTRHGKSYDGDFGEIIIVCEAKAVKRCEMCKKGEKCDVVRHDMVRHDMV
jgi:hypothetical protein